MDSEGKFNEWCIVEVMGHNRYAGRVTEQQIGGASFIRVDVPEIEGRPAFTKLLSPGSIFAITPCVEQTARVAAQGFRVRPFAMFELPMLPTSVDRDEELFDDEDENKEF